MPSAWSARLCTAAPVGADTRALIEIPTDSLVIDSDVARRVAGLGSGPGEEDVREIQAKMLDAEHLDAAAHRTIRLAIDSVTSLEGDSVTAHASLSLHGVTRDVAAPALVDGPERGSLSVSGSLRIRQTDYGMEPESVAGVVNVADEVDLVFRLVAHERDHACRLDR